MVLEMDEELDENNLASGMNVLRTDELIRQIEEYRNESRDECRRQVWGRPSFSK